MRPRVQVTVIGTVWSLLSVLCFLKWHAPIRGWIFGSMGAGFLLSGLFILGFAAVFLWAGWEFTRFALKRFSELAELPLWLIHVAWPVTGVTWIVFLGEQVLSDLRIISGRTS